MRKRRGGSRAHTSRRSGTKVTYPTWEAASGAAIRRVAEWGCGIEPYKCADCPGFHIGTARPRREDPRERQPELLLEFGERVTGCLLAENATGSPRRRREAVVRRAQGAERRRVAELEAQQVVARTATVGTVSAMDRRTGRQTTGASR